MPKQSEIPNPKSEIRLVVGLGNPGARYPRTRHNVGYRVIDRLESVGNLKVRLLKPESVFMNESGGPVQQWAHKNGILPSEMLIVCDDFSIPLGQLRMRLKGSSGGQNGLKSILERFGTLAVPRLRVGIGPVPEGMDPADFVLQGFAKNDEHVAEEAIGRAADAVLVAVQEGIEAAMNRFNLRKGEDA